MLTSQRSATIRHQADVEHSEDVLVGEAANTGMRENGGGSARAARAVVVSRHPGEWPICGGAGIKNSWRPQQASFFARGTRGLLELLGMSSGPSLGDVSDLLWRSPTEAACGVHDPPSESAIQLLPPLRLSPLG